MVFHLFQKHWQKKNKLINDFNNRKLRKIEGKEMAQNYGTRDTRKELKDTKFLLKDVAKRITEAKKTGTWMN